MMRPVLALLLLVATASAASLADFAPGASLLESFDEGWEDKWIHSSNEKYAGRFTVTDSSDPELQIPEKEKHYGLTALLSKPLDPSQGLVLQYEATFSTGYNCGGSYVKLLTHTEGFAADDLVDSTPYSIMFGPDKCGDPSGKIHMILRHRNPISGEISEKHLKPHPTPLVDTVPHVYTLIINPDNTFEVLVDGEVKSSGSLLEKLEPSINPPAEIPDPEDTKPEDWVDKEKIADPEATQPEDWDLRPEVPDEAAVKPTGWLDDTPATISDPSAKRPAGWDDEEDGEWEAPIIANPKCKKVGCGEWKRPVVRNPAYKGAWKAPLIDNPEYKGPWIQKKIPNPDFHEDQTPLKSIGLIGALAFEIWTIDTGYQFDNIYVGSDPAEAAKLRDKVWQPKFAAQKAEHESKMKAAAEEAAKKRQADLEKSKKEVLPLDERMALTALSYLESKELKFLFPFTEALIGALRRNPSSVYGLVAAPVVFIVVLALAIPGMRMTKKSRLQKAREAEEKLEDSAAVTEEKEEEEEEKKEKEEPKAEPKEEVIADEDADEGTAVRRRARRA